MNTRITVRMVGGAEVIIDEDLPESEEEYTIIANEILKALPAGNVYYVHNHEDAGTYRGDGTGRIKRWVQMFNGEYITYAKIEEL